MQGNDIPGWPINIGNDVVGSVLFEDLNGDSYPEVISFSNSKISLHSLDGSDFLQGEITSDLQITSASVIADSDQDGDMEIIFGNAMGVVSIDCKDVSSPLGMINMFRFNNKRNGYFNQALVMGDLNGDQINDILDIVILTNIILEFISPTVDQSHLGDLNFDSYIDVLDILLLINVVLGD